MKKYLWLFIGILFSASGFCDDEISGQTYEINDFSGGINTKSNQFSIPKDKGDIAENVRFGTKLKSLSKRDNLNVYGTADATEQITGMHRHYAKNGDKVLVVSHGDEIEKGNDTTGDFTNILNLTSGDHKWQFVTWHDIVIGSDGYNQPIKYDGSSASATYLGSLLATDAGSGSGPVTGSYTYKVSCYSATKEVLLNTASNTFSANGNDINLSMIPVCPDTILSTTTTGRKIYRTESNGSTYKLLSNGTIANNTAVTLTDSDADAALGSAMPAGDDTWTPPKGKFLLVQNNRLFVGNDPSNNPSRLYWSNDGSHDIFDDSQTTYYFDVRKDDGDEITSIKGVLGIITVAKNNTIQKVYIDGADPDSDWAISDPISYVGVQAPYSTVNTPIGMIYLNRTGIYRFNGQYSQLISDVVTPEIEDISDTDFTNVWGVFHENKYYMAYTSKESAVAYNNRVLIFDTIVNAYSIDLLNINAFSVFNSGDDWGILYGGASDSGKVYAYSDETNEVIHKRHSDFTGLWDDMRYIPTETTGNSESPIIEISRTETINELEGAIDNLIGTIDRQDTKGYYVSQPISISAQSYDKLYWNETMPSSGGDVIFRLRTSATGEKNLLHNDDFEFWDNTLTDTQSTIAPNDWIFRMNTGTGGGATKDTSVVKRGTYSTKITKPNTGNSILERRISATNPTSYVGKTMVFSGYAKSANSIANKVWFEIQDNVDTQPTIAYYGNSGNWVESETSNTIASTATSITVRCVVGSEADAVSYFDQVMMIEGTTAENDWSAWSSDFTNPSGSDISGVSAAAYLQYQIEMSTNDIAYSPNIIKNSNYNVKLNYERQGTSQSTSIPIRWRSGFFDLGYPDRIKELKWIYVYHSGTSGTLNIQFENLEGDTDTFAIDLSQYHSFYKEAFTSGKFTGQNFRVTITNDDDEPLRVDKIVLKYDVSPRGRE